MEGSFKSSGHENIELSIYDAEPDQVGVEWLKLQVQIIVIVYLSFYINMNIVYKLA